MKKEELPRCVPVFIRVEALKSTLTSNMYCSDRSCYWYYLSWKSHTWWPAIDIEMCYRHPTSRMKFVRWKYIKRYTFAVETQYIYLQVIEALGCVWVIKPGRFSNSNGFMVLGPARNAWKEGWERMKWLKSRVRILCFFSRDVSICCLPWFGETTSVDAYVYSLYM